jgi:ABC-type sugar transport system ATPase subunit
VAVLPLEISDIKKRFGAVEALKGVDLSISPGECLAVVGENGAGKSTLMKVLAGIEKPDAGTIRANGVDTQIPDLKKAVELGICLVHQELLYVPELSVAQNIFLGREKTRYGFIRKNLQRAMTTELLAELGFAVDVKKPMSSLSVAEQQLVEIAKGLSQNAELVIMDEPTSALAPAEVERLFEIIKALTESRKSVIYISHRVDEIGEIADRVLVMRDGLVVGELPASADSREVVALMVGREIDELYPKAESTPGDVLFEAHGLSAKGISDISFALHQGEILGIGGLVGAGQGVVAHALFGRSKLESGSLVLYGSPCSQVTPEFLVRNGVVYVGEDRRTEGLNLNASIVKNTTLPVLRRLSRGGFLRLSQLEAVTEEQITRLRIRAHSANQRVTQLSGGNQQKVVLSKALITEPNVLILVEPTRGIDVGARAEIYQLLEELVLEGKAVILISSDLDELRGMSDRLIVMYRGRIAGVLDKGEASRERIALLATGQAFTGDS